MSFEVLEDNNEICSCTGCDINGTPLVIMARKFEMSDSGEDYSFFIAAYCKECLENALELINEASE